MKENLEIFIDGACRGNPGEASIGIVIKHNAQTIKEVAKPIGKATNNIAEYQALIEALHEARGLKAQRLKFYTDSELVYKQVTGVYQVKNSNLKLLHDQVRDLIGLFQDVQIMNVPREQNREADRLASAILKDKQAKVVAPLFKTNGEESPSSKG